MTYAQKARERASTLSKMYGPHLGAGIIHLQFEEDITQALLDARDEALEEAANASHLRDGKPFPVSHPYFVTGSNVTDEEIKAYNAGREYGEQPASDYISAIHTQLEGYKQGYEAYKARCFRLE